MNQEFEDKDKNSEETDLPLPPEMYPKEDFALGEVDGDELRRAIKEAIEE